MTTNPTIKPTQFAALLREAYDAGLVTKKDMRVAGAMFVSSNNREARVTIKGGWTVTVNPESLTCDCGKGILCPLNRQIKIKHPELHGY